MKLRHDLTTFAFMLSFLKSLFIRKKEAPDPMKYLIVGLGNLDKKYNFTRHNVGFEVVDYLVQEKDGTWKSGKYALTSTIKHKGRTLHCLKPTTYMNLSGKAVLYWMNKYNIKLANVLVIVDDLNIDFGTIRLKTKGSDGGHNGLKDINERLGTQQYARLRIGIGAEFGKGQQVNFVLGQWSDEEVEGLQKILPAAASTVLSFATIGPQLTMSDINKKTIL